MSCLKPKHCVGSAAVSTHPAPGTTHPHKPLAMLYNHKNTCDKVLEEMGAQCGTAAMPANNQALGGQQASATCSICCPVWVSMNLQAESKAQMERAWQACIPHAKGLAKRWPVWQWSVRWEEAHKAETVVDVVDAQVQTEEVGRGTVR